MADLKQNIKDLAVELKAVKKSLNLKEKRTKLLELEAKSTDPDFWDDQENARKVMQEFGDIKDQVGKVEQVEQVIKDAQVAVELGMDKELKEKVNEAQKLIGKLKTASFLSDPYDKKNAIVFLHAGQGGTEAMDWVSILYRMYLKFCEKRKWKTEVIEQSSGEEAGIKKVTFKVEGEYAFGYLKGEMGTHRLVRQSPFNADQKRETSFALVEILPELGEVDLPNVEISDDDLEWQFYRSSGSGGQNVNKVSTAVRLVHKPSGIVVTAQTERSQLQNRENAMALLRAKLWALEEKKRDEQVGELKGEYRPASWGNQIRSYVLHPYKMVKDLRTEVETSDTEGVLDGDLDEFIEAELRMVNSR